MKLSTLFSILSGLLLGGVVISMLIFLLFFSGVEGIIAGAFILGIGCIIIGAILDSKGR